MTEKETSIKEEAKKVNTAEEVADEKFAYGVQPFLTVIMIKGKLAFRFEMPIGTQWDVCVEASEEILKTVKGMRDDAAKKQKEMEAKAKEVEKEKKSESADVDTKKEEKKA